MKGICHLKSVAAELIDLLFQSTVGNTDHFLCEKQEPMILIDNMINHPEVTLEEIANATNYSKRHVARLIKQQYGVSLGILKKQSQKGQVTK